MVKRQLLEQLLVDGAPIDGGSAGVAQPVAATASVADTLDQESGGPSENQESADARSAAGLRDEQDSPPSRQAHAGTADTSPEPAGPEQEGAAGVGSPDTEACAAAGLPATGGVVELALLTLACVLIERFLVGGGIGFFGVHPNPLWLLVLWGAVRGGVALAIPAALGATILHAAGYAYAFGYGIEMLEQSAVLWPSCLFLVVAFLFGQARDGIHQDRLEARREQSSLSVKVGEQQQDVALLRQANRELKRRIFDRSFDFQSLMLTVASNTGSSDDKIFDVPLDMLRDFCGASKCSVLYVLPGELLDLAAQRGWSDGERRVRLEAMRASERLQQAVAQGRPVVGLQDDGAKPGEPLLVAPLADTSGVVKAVLCVDEMPPQRFDQDTIKTFLGIATWVATTLRRTDIGQAREVTWQSVKQAFEASKSIGTAEQLSERLYLEDARRTRYGVETVLVAVRLHDASSSREDEVESLEATATRVLGAAIRQTDDAYRFGFAGSYMLVMTGCQTSHGQAVSDRLKARFDALVDDSLGNVEMRVFSVGDVYPKLADTLPDVARFFFAEPGSNDPIRCPVPDPHPQRRGTAKDFVRRLRLEVELARRREWDLNIIEYRSSDRGISVAPILARHLWNNVGENLRVTDGIYVLGSDRCIVMLPCTSCLDATRIWQRLKEDLAASMPGELFQNVESEFLALADMDVKDVLMHVLGGSVDERVDDEPVISQVELDHLADAMAEFGEMGASAEPLFSDGAPTSQSVRDGLGWLGSFDPESGSVAEEAPPEASLETPIAEEAAEETAEDVAEDADDSRHGDSRDDDDQDSVVVDVTDAVREAAREAMRELLSQSDPALRGNAGDELRQGLRRALDQDLADRNVGQPNERSVEGQTAAHDAAQDAGAAADPRMQSFLAQVEALQKLGESLRQQLQLPRDSDPAEAAPQSSPPHAPGPDSEERP
ncbi:MAG: GAF domain-containing protein [Planctomycetota bacterium]